MTILVLWHLQEMAPKALHDARKARQEVGVSLVGLLFDIKEPTGRLYAVARLQEAMKDRVFVPPKNVMITTASKRVRVTTLFLKDAVWLFTVYIGSGR